MKKIISLLLALIMVFSLAACGASKEADTGLSGSKGDGGIISGIINKTESAVGMDGVMGDAEMAPMAPGESIIAPEPGGDEQKPVYVAGTLTAGEWKDAENLDFWKNLLNRNDWYQLMENRNLFTNKVVPVHVIDMEGYPCFNADVYLVDEQGNALYHAVSDAHGNAYLLYNLNKGEDEKPVSVKVEDETYPINAEGITETKLNEFTTEINDLDLMLMIDTTGSMGDELQYLQKELENVINTVAKDNQVLSIRLSVNFYRDEEDEYVVKSYDFTDDIEKAVTQLNAQRTDGGGDYPEAVHKALNNIIQEHNWRKNAVKLCFFVMDAPPHSEQEIKDINATMQKSIEAMAAEGIRLIPVASSGVDTETEFLLRSWSLMTGGTYTFLTDHSGVGNDHLEPTIGDYEVEKLNDLMVRIIREYCGAITVNIPENQQ